MIDEILGKMEIIGAIWCGGVTVLIIGMCLQNYMKKGR